MTMMRLDGALNFRDVGGVPVGSDRQVAYKRLFRSDTLQFLTPSDVTVLTRTVGLRSDIDLRLSFELEAEGRGPLEDTDVTLHHLPFFVEGAHQTGSATPILRKDDPVVSHYLDYLISSPRSVAGIISILSRQESIPAIIHCAAGKDRTGIAVAMTLAALGCTPEAIAQEYSAGSEHIPAVMDRLRTMRSYGDSLANLHSDALLTPPEYIARFFEGVTSAYGGPLDFLRANGVTDQELENLFGLLTEPRA